MDWFKCQIWSHIICCEVQLHEKVRPLVVLGVTITQLTLRTGHS